jgi:hypothetical protein
MPARHDILVGALDLPWRTTPDPISAGSHDRFFLLVDEFDPHEPFDTPLPNAAMYNEEREGGLAIWPPYPVDAVASGQPDLRKARHIRGNYGAKLTMIDHWFGRLPTWWCGWGSGSRLPLATTGSGGLGGPLRGQEQHDDQGDDRKEEPRITQPTAWRPLRLAML